MNGKVILHLNLKRKWFDMIKAGKKATEYRNLSPYWMTRFRRVTILGCHFYSVEIKGKRYIPNDVVICFSNGYARDREQFHIELLDISVGAGVQRLGANKGQYYFKLKLGNIIQP